MATFNGSEGGPISLETIKSGRQTTGATIKPGETEAHYWGVAIIRRLLDEDRDVGIRAYHAIDDNGEKQLLLVGVDEDGNNLLPKRVRHQSLRDS